jgi:hypothetical protein
MKEKEIKQQEEFDKLIKKHIDPLCRGDVAFYLFDRETMEAFCKIFYYSGMIQIVESQERDLKEELLQKRQENLTLFSGR